VITFYKIRSMAKAKVFINQAEVGCLWTNESGCHFSYLMWSDLHVLKEVCKLGMVEYWETAPFFLFFPFLCSMSVETGIPF